MSEQQGFEPFTGSLSHSPSEPQSPGISRRTLLIGAGVAAAGVAAGIGGTLLWRGSHDQHPPTETIAPSEPSRPPTTTSPSMAPSESKIVWPALGRDFKPEASWLQDFTTMPNGPLDQDYWTPDTDYRQPPKIQSEAAYTNETQNVRIEGGNLILQASRVQTPYTYPDDPRKKPYGYTSARVDTKGKFSMQYGLLEASIQMPTGRGTWPAFWLLPENRERTRSLGPAGRNSEKAYVRGGEIDIMEYYGVRPGLSDGVLHTVDKMSKKQVEGNFEDRFNTFGISLEPGKLSFLLNGSVYYELAPSTTTPEAWPFTEADNNFMYPILNLAMGGSGGKEIDDRNNTWTMRIQGLRYHELAA